MTILLIIIFVLWTVVVIKNILFWVYVWQLKEYRYDRMKDHFRLPSSKKLILNKRTNILGLLLILSLVSISFVHTISTLLAVLFYSFFASRALQQFQEKSLKIPKLTLRAILVTFFIIISYGAITVPIFFRITFFTLTWFLLADILVPIFVLLGVFASHSVSNFIKNKIIANATRKRRNMKDLLVIGITGSYGKSSVKEILAAILSRKFKVLKTSANINSDIGIAKIILKQLKKDHEIFIVEMGAYRRGEIKKTSKIVQQQIGILTGINNQHVSLFGNIQNTQKAKYELMEALPTKGLAIFNGDNEITKKLFTQCKKVKRLYSANALMDSSNQEIILQSLKVTSRGMELKIQEGDQEQILKTPLLGRHNATNIMGAVTVARELDVTYEDIKIALAHLKSLPNALQIKKGIKGSTVIDDSYSANVDGVLAALDLLKNMPGRRKICILQPLIELGDTSETAHKIIAKRIAEVCDFCIITSKDFFFIMYKEVIENGMEKNNIYSLPNPQEALRKAQELTDKDDIVLIENRVPQKVIDGLVLHK